MSLSLWTRVLLSAAGLLGFAGVAVGAAAAHESGGEFGRLASEFLLIHAAAICGIAGIAERAVSRVGALRFAAAALAVGSACFATDLCLLAFAGLHPLSWLAPAGGLVMLAGWALLAIVPILPARAR
jgi:uncharacterized membrane protein YgdD (TMEM256/DUF423 family)